MARRVNSALVKDYYKILGVVKDADDAALKAAYRKLARQHHPDVNPGSKEAEDKFKDIGEAYDVLSDPQKRAEYDESRAARPKAGVKTQDGPTGGASGFSGADGFGGIFDGLFGGKVPNRGETKIPGVKLRPSAAAPEQTLEITLEEAAHGGERTYAVSTDAPCPDCKGTGKTQSGRDGLNLGARCASCRGTGRKTLREDVSVAIPKGIADGAKLRLRGKGKVARDGVREDLLLTVRLKPHARFERDGKNLTFDVTVPFTVAALGGDIAVETLSGPRTLSVPAGTQPGQKMRLSGQGLPGAKGETPGDLLARLKVVVPRDLSARERELLREMAQIRRDPVRD